MIDFARLKVLVEKASEEMVPSPVHDAAVRSNNGAILGARYSLNGRYLDLARELLALSEENARLSASVAVLERELADEEGVNRILVRGLGDRNGRLQEIARLASQAIADGGAVTVLGRIAGLATLANGDSIAALEGKQP